MLAVRISKVVLAGISLVACLALVGCPSEDVVAVDEIEDIALADIEEEGLTFSYDGDPGTPLEVGDIVTGTEGGGYLRRLMAVDQDGNTVVAETEQVSLAEALEVGVLDADVTFTAKDFADSGVPLIATGTTIIDLSNTVIFDQDGVTLTITRGTLDFAPTIELDATWADHRLTALTAVTTGEMTLNLDMKLAAADEAVLAYEIDVFPPITKPFLFYIGPVPVMGTASLEFPFGVIGTVNGSASVESGFDATGTITIGGEYADNEWTDLSDVNGFAPNPHPVVWTFAAGAGVDVFVKPKAGLNLYGVSDLTAAAIPYISANARLLPPPQNFVLTAGLDGIITYELGIFDFNLVDETWFFPGPQWVLFSWTAGE